MGERSKTIGFRPDETIRNDFQQFREANGYDKSEALEELVETGLREKQGPILYRIKQQAIDAAFYLTLVAVVIAVVSFTTDQLTFGHGIEIALVLLSIGMVPIALVELARYLRGRSELRDTRGDNA